MIWSVAWQVAHIYAFHTRRYVSERASELASRVSDTTNVRQTRNELGIKEQISVRETRTVKVEVHRILCAVMISLGGSDTNRSGGRVKHGPRNGGLSRRKAARHSSETVFRDAWSDFAE
jgi:hypothetical protein